MPRDRHRRAVGKRRIAGISGMLAVGSSHEDDTRQNDETLAWPQLSSGGGHYAGRPHKAKGGARRPRLSNVNRWSGSNSVRELRGEHVARVALVEGARAPAIKPAAGRVIVLHA